VPINLVPLRERREDIPLLVQYFLNRVCVEMDVPLKQCSDEATALLSAYSWPGNVRELENAIKRAVILSSDPQLTPADFPGLESAPGIEKSGDRDASLEELVDGKLRSCLHGIEQLENGEIHSMVLEQVERPLIRIILEKTRWNQVKAADILGINRNTLRKKISELGIEMKRD
jgi:two-component system nitrogen regulation response regulator GlnG